MAMDAATGVGADTIIELKYDETGTTHFNRNINFIKLLYDVTFLTSPKHIGITSRRNLINS